MSSRVEILKKILKHVENINVKDDHDHQEAFILLKLAIDTNDVKKCPFNTPGFEFPDSFDELTPCPVCGMLGTYDAEDKCID